MNILLLQPFYQFVIRKDWWSGVNVWEMMLPIMLLVKLHHEAPKFIICVRII